MLDILIQYFVVAMQEPCVTFLVRNTIRGDEGDILTYIFMHINTKTSYVCKLVENITIHSQRKIKFSKKFGKIDCYFICYFSPLCYVKQSNCRLYKATNTSRSQEGNKPNTLYSWHIKVGCISHATALY